MAINTDTLVQQSACIDRCIPDGMKLAVLIEIFANIAGMAINTDSLIQNAVCINRCIPKGDQLGVLIYLAYLIQAGGGGGGGGVNQQVFNKDYGGGTPTDIPTSGSGIARDTSNGAVWWYVNGAWQ